MVSQFRVFNSISAALVSLAISASSALADDEIPKGPNTSDAALRSAQSVNTPDKKQRWLRENYQISMSQKWPVNFPVPVYTSNVLHTTFANSTQGQPTAAATLATKDSASQVFDFYTSALSRAKWTVRLPSPKARDSMHLGDDYFFLTAEQGKQTIDLTCARNKKSNTTFVSISWRKSL